MSRKGARRVFKLMKYEFRKIRSTLLVMVLGLIVLELVFLYGVHAMKDVPIAISTVLITWLTFGVYLYILVSGIVGYSRELSNRTGYLAFMTPVRPIGIVLSKLVFTALIAIAVTALFGAGAYLDYRFLLRRANIGADKLRQASFIMEMLLDVEGLSANLMSYARFIIYAAVSMLCGMLLIMCTAFLAITLSATVLENRKGFLRGFLSFVFFAALSYGTTRLTGEVSGALLAAPETADLAYLNSANMTAALAATIALQLILGGAFAALSALLLDRRVSL